MAKDMEVITDVQQELSIYQFDDFLRRRYIAFLSRTSMYFSWVLILVWLCICVYNMYNVQLSVLVHSLVCMVDIPVIFVMSPH
jgi:hypothetical protein